MIKTLSVSTVVQMGEQFFPCSITEQRLLPNLTHLQSLAYTELNSSKTRFQVLLFKINLGLPFLHGETLFPVPIR